MLKNDEAEELLKNFVRARNKYNKAKKDKDLERKYRYYQSVCIEKFSYIVLTKASRYKNFLNYPDLVQEGLLALTFALNTYKPRKGNFYAWAHKYVSTKISRCASKHSTIKVPLQKAKKICPTKVSGNIPSIIDPALSSHEQIENIQDKQEVIQALSNLSNQQRKIILLNYGFGDIKSYSINKISRQLGISTAECLMIRDEALDELKKYLTITELF